MVTISVCMIVKNEEDKLARCLDCVKGFADEIIIVDTGSNDKTKEIAAKYTDKIYDFEWVDDFSKARNFSFLKATMDYIYTADADEIIDEVNQNKIKDIKQVMLDEIEIVQMYYTNQLEFGSAYNYDKEPRPKLFKRCRNFVWQDPVHETIRTFPVVYDSDVEIIHKPHEAHADRDLQTFRGAIARNSEDVTAGLTANARCMYAKELLHSGTDEDVLLAKNYFRSMVDAGVLNQQELNEAVCVLCRCAVIEDDLHSLMKYSMKNVCETANSEVCYFVGEYYMLHKDYDEAYVWLYNAAFETSPLLVLKYGKELAVDKLIECCEMLGDMQQAQQLRENYCGR